MAWPGLEGASQAEQPRLSEPSFPTSAGQLSFIFDVSGFKKTKVFFLKV